MGKARQTCDVCGAVSLAPAQRRHWEKRMGRRYPGFAVRCSLLVAASFCYCPLCDGERREPYGIWLSLLTHYEDFNPGAQYLLKLELAYQEKTIQQFNDTVDGMIAEYDEYLTQETGNV